MATPSLLLIPDRYKASKLYSQIPDSGAGDLAFTRALDTATRVNSAGLIEKVRTNVALYSEQFNDASWQKINATVTANATTAPNGTLTAEKLIDNAVNSPHYVLSTNTSLSNITTVSFFAKKAERNFALVFLNNTASTAAWFDLDNGTIGNKQAAVLSHSIISAGNGWFRCTATFSFVSANDFCISVATANDVFSYVGDGASGIFIWGAQAETGDIATDYIPTTTAAVSVGPIANIPRIDYTGGGCGKLLLEPQRTNLVTFSEQFDNSAWTKSGSSITANAAISPDGFMNADKIVENSADSGHTAFQVVSVASGSIYTLSVFAKSAERTRVWVDLFGGGTSANFDLTNGTILAFNAGVTAKIENYGNGWYRCSITAAAPDSLVYPNIGPTTSSTASPGYQGNGTSGVFVYGAQLE